MTLEEKNSKRCVVSVSEKMERITFCVEMIQKGHTDFEIKKAFEKHFNRTSNISKQYLRLAYETIRETFAHSKVDDFNSVMSMLHDLYQTAYKKGHTKVCVSILEQINKMRGNYEAQKLDVKVEEWTCRFGDEDENENKDA